MSIVSLPPYKPYIWHILKTGLEHLSSSPRVRNYLQFNTTKDKICDH